MQYDTYRIVWVEATSTIVADRLSSNSVGFSTHRHVEYDLNTHEVYYTTDLDPTYDKDQYFADLHTRLFHYHRWAEQMAYAIGDSYTYEEANDTKSKIFLNHLNDWYDRVDLFDNLMKGAYGNIMGRTY